MDFTAAGKTLFLLHTGRSPRPRTRLTITTWEGGETNMPLAHLLAFIHYLQKAAPQLLEGDDQEPEGSAAP